MESFGTAIAIGTPYEELKQRYHGLSHCRTDTLLRAYEDDIMKLCDAPFTDVDLQNYLDMISICHPKKQPK